MQAEQILYSKINQPIATHCILQKKKKKNELPYEQKLFMTTCLS